jgi:hypothetical protein
MQLHELLQVLSGISGITGGKRNLGPKKLSVPVSRRTVLRKEYPS